MGKVNTLVVGSVVMSKSIFESIIKIKNIKIVGVITKKKSNFHSDFYSLEKDALKIGAEVLFLNENEDEKIISFINKVDADIGFCIGWSHLFSKRVLEALARGMIGFHPTNLPYNRGRHPIIWSLVLGLKETSSSFFLMNSIADGGGILSQKKIKIDKNDDASTLYKKIAATASLQIHNFVPNYLSGKIKPLHQNKNIGNSWRKRSNSDGKIDWRMSYDAIECLVKALRTPYPGATCSYLGNEFIISKVKRGKNNNKSYEPGKILEVINRKIEVKCWNSSVYLLEHNFKKLPKKGEYLL